MNALDRFLLKCDVRQGRTLIAGSKIHEGTGKEDRRKLYKDVIGVDMEAGEGVDAVVDLECLDLECPWHWEELEAAEFSHIECTSVLEHSRRPWELCANLQEMLIDGGTITVLVPWVWREHNYPSDYWRFTPQAIASLLPSIEWEAQSYIVEEKLVKNVPKITHKKIRYLARSELVMFGRKRVSE